MSQARLKNRQRSTAANGSLWRRRALRIVREAGDRPPTLKELAARLALATWIDCAPE